jgi:carboxynorspermidine decarboxylase
MKIVNSFKDIKTPFFLCDEVLLEKNLKLLDYVQQKSGVKILLALKGYALWSTFDLCKKYLSGCCASGLHEAKLAYTKFGKEVHTYSVAFKDEDIDEILNISNNIIFNSFSQYNRFKSKLSSNISVGFRINPEVSTVKVPLYDPCSSVSRLGVTKKEFEKNILLDNSFLFSIDGLHFHALCEQNVDDLRLVLDKFEKNFKDYFKYLKWINFGGGHHITRSDYDVEGLIILLNEFKIKYPNITIYLEPGEAIGWKTGYLVTKVLDIVYNNQNIAILDTSAEAHMSDVLAMPYRPSIKNAFLPNEKKYTYQLGGTTCLAGDIIGEYSFKNELKIGDLIIIEDMIHYTMVKTTTFNGINLPSIVLKKSDGLCHIIKDFGYNDYFSRLS